MHFFDSPLLAFLTFISYSSAAETSDHHDHIDEEYLAPHQQDAYGRKDFLYSYFESPLDNDVGHIGPTHWKDLSIEGNQCGGGGQKNGFGQSPILIPYANHSTCDTDTEGYESFGGDCTYADLDYLILKGSLAVRVKKGSDGKKVCSLDSWKIPQSDKLYEATEFHVKSGEEHLLEGGRGIMEIQIFYQESSGETQAAFAFTVVDPLHLASNPFSTVNENEVIENFLKGWRTTFYETQDYCNEKTSEENTYNVNTVLKEKQQYMICQDFDNPAYAGETWIPSGTKPSPAPISNLVSDISGMTQNIDESSVITYEGSLTTPPCTENVYWNLIRHHVIISHKQAAELLILINCVKERSSCQWSSAASEFGKTVRPPQQLNGRKLVHRCHGKPHRDITHDAPEYEAYEKQELDSPIYAILFPFSITLVGLFVYYFVSRILHLIPYTAILFVIGTFIGLILPFIDSDDQLNRSASMWNEINGELLLVSFLPGLIFKDAYCLDVHLFMKALPQTLLWAFPTVLAGTSLVAVFVYYILGYDWDFFLCMTFGAIVSATDPVSVSALLQELGAPPRLQTHISGESLLNDGSAIVFFSIFKDLYLFNQKIEGGHSIGLGEGIWTFIKMSIGAAILGVLFGILLVFILYVLNRRFNTEEKIVQVTATYCLAYLTYYVGEVLLHMSGVIAVVFLGLTTKFAADSLIIDHDMMNKFWALIEHLLNTILFAVGGVVWGVIISQNDDLPVNFGARDWGYLFATYIFIFVSRFFLFVAAFPIVNRIGLKSDWREMVFHAYGGLRGAVGIALAISLNHEVVRDTTQIDPRRIPTLQCFGLVGGVSLLSLLINGSTAGYVLKYFKLNRSTKERTDILKGYDNYLTKRSLEMFITLIGENVYKDIDFDLVTKYIPQLSALTYKDIRGAIKSVKYTRPSHLYNEPEVAVFQAILTDEELEKLKSLAKIKLFERLQGDYITACALLPDELHSDDKELSEQVVRELRLVFVELLGRAYEEAMTCGQIDVRDGAVVHILKSSVAVTGDEVSNGLPINDWSHTQRYNSYVEKIERISTKIHLATAFILAHTEAQRTFKFKVHQGKFLSNEERKILAESEDQVSMAYEVLNTINPLKLKQVMSRKLCVVILNSAAIEISELVKFGLLKETEGEHYFEHLEEDIRNVKGKLNEKKEADPQGRGRMTSSRKTFLNVDPTAYAELRAEYEYALNED